jgi:hypothetical protein
MRLLLARLRRLPDGPVPRGGADGRAYAVYRLAQILVWAPLLHGHLLPAPLRTALAGALGARLGRGAMCAGAPCDPPFLTIGAGSLVGLGTLLPAHAIERGGEVIGRITIGAGCLIGGHSVLMPGVVVGDGAVVASGAIVLKDTVIPPGETWGGVPARRLRPAP